METGDVAAHSFKGFFRYIGHANMDFIGMTTVSILIAVSLDTESKDTATYS